VLTPIPLPSPNKLSLLRLDGIVAARLGETRVPGNAQPAVLNRQVAMYLAKRIGGWSYEAIGRFYNGRNHSTVHYAVRRVEALRENSPDLDTLLCDLRQAIANASDELSPQQKSADLQLKSRKVVALAKNEVMLEALAERVAATWVALRALVLDPGRVSQFGKRLLSRAHRAASSTCKNFFLKTPHVQVFGKKSSCKPSAQSAPPMR
jgi:hypothetical protein